MTLDDQSFLSSGIAIVALIIIVKFGDEKDPKPAQISVQLLLFGLGVDNSHEIIQSPCSYDYIEHPVRS